MSYDTAYSIAELSPTAATFTMNHLTQQHIAIVAVLPLSEAFQCHSPLTSIRTRSGTVAYVADGPALFVCEVKSLQCQWQRLCKAFRTRVATA